MEYGRKRRKDAGIPRGRRVPGEDVTYAFKLNTENDATVIAIIAQWRQQQAQSGKTPSLRPLMVEALNAWAGLAPAQQDAAGGGVALADLERTLDDRVQALLEELQLLLDEKLANVSVRGGKAKSAKKPGMSASYLANLQEALRGGEE